MDTRRSRRDDQLRALTRSALTAASGHLDVEPETTGNNPVRWIVGPRIVIGIVVVVLLVSSIMLARAWAGRPPEPVLLTGATTHESHSSTERSEPPEDTSESASHGPETPSTLLVHVAGAVHDPDVVELRPGARTHDAIAAAGGATSDADLAAVNLAREVTDGEQIYIPAQGEEPRPNPPASPGDPAAGNGASNQGDDSASPINLNTATATELQELSGIGPALAERIIDHRDTYGAFTHTDQLQEVSGIGPAIMDRIGNDVTV